MIKKGPPTKWGAARLRSVTCRRVKSGAARGKVIVVDVIVAAVAVVVAIAVAVAVSLLLSNRPNHKQV